MKKMSLFISLLILFSVSHSQILKKVAQKAKQKAEEKAIEKIDKKKEQPAGENKDNPEGNEVKTGQDTITKEPASAGVQASLKVYSKYDFVPGEKIVALEDFMQDAIGDFPAKWNTNASGEVVTIDGNPGHWFMMHRAGTFMPEFIDSLQDNFTFEFDLIAIHGNKTGSWPSFHTAIAELSDRDKPQHWQTASNHFYFSVYAGNSTDGSISSARRKNGGSEASEQIITKHFADKSKPVHISMWRQKERLRIYFNEEKVLDIPRALASNAKFNSILYFIPSVDEDNRYCVNNLRLAVGAPDARKKILEQNKWVTHGILFDVNSANIKPESYGTLKEMANVLKEYTDLKVKIVGHTDADGKDADNLDLSKRRAASVKAALAKEFSIDESRMETDGKGETEPIDKNDNPAGKANNRRVEFIKI
ncbi:MAG: OmpA family protein [Chitinophagaceae bacterium]|nr:OmpA family protein [Chitinophagaceae bacterium]